MAILNGLRFPFIECTNSVGLSSVMPYLSITLSYRNRSTEQLALLDTGASVNVLTCICLDTSYRSTIDLGSYELLCRVRCLFLPCRPCLRVASKSNIEAPNSAIRPTSSQSRQYRTDMRVGMRCYLPPQSFTVSHTVRARAGDRPVLED